MSNDITEPAPDPATVAKAMYAFLGRLAAIVVADLQAPEPQRSPRHDKPDPDRPGT